MSFIRAVFSDNRLSSINKKLAALYLLNVTDIIFTLFLINTGMFAEANFIMAPLVYNDRLLSLSIKIVIPLVLLAYIFFRMRRATEKQLYKSNIIITGCLAFYGLVNISHIVWFILYGVVELL